MDRLYVDISHKLLKEGIEDGKRFYRINIEPPLGLYTNKAFSKNEIIYELEGVLRKNPSRSSIHIGNNLHVEDHNYGKYINHSFEPNTKIELNKIIALRDIKPHEELTFNYNDSEVDIAYPFEVNGIMVTGKSK